MLAIVGLGADRGSGACPRATNVGALTLLTGVSRGDEALLIAGVFSIIMSWGLIGLIWALLVDRSTLRGVIDKPDESIESKWLDAAMSGAFSDTVMLTGFALAALAISGFEFDAMWALIGVIVIAFFSAFVRYLMAKKRG
ncbi:MAG: hypothetical protein ACTHY8_01365 [Microbacterium gubbeenense]|uniref:hypothetical protein n=1 Tax=Microbacterium gubbeenense TaxID=159896 RepID=UPI003F9C84E8